MTETNKDTASSDLHVTVASCPSPTIVDQGIIAHLDNDLDLLKPAILYADTTTLFSPLSNLFGKICHVRQTIAQDSITAQLSSLAKVSDSVKLPDDLLALLQACQSIEAKKHRSSKEIVLLRTLAVKMRKLWKVYETSGIDMPGWPLIRQVFGAVDGGRLDFHTFQEPSQRTPNLTVFAQFLERVKAALDDPSTYPLLDDNTGFLVSTQSHLGGFTPSPASTTRARQVSVVADLFRRLPQFELASLDETLGVRSELEKYLTRFRSAIIKYSSNIGSAPWDHDFPFDAQQLFLSEVAPALLDIEEQTRSNSYLSKLTRRYADSPGTFAVPTLSIGMSNWAGLSEIVASVLGIAPAAANAIFAYRDWKASKREVSQNQMFFYYQAQRRLL